MTCCIVKSICCVQIDYTLCPLLIASVWALRLHTVCCCNRKDGKTVCKDTFAGYVCTCGSGFISHTDAKNGSEVHLVGLSIVMYLFRNFDIQLCGETE